MLLFPTLQVLDPDVHPAEVKLHLATWNGHEDPLDEFFAGRFEEWQSLQGRRNFERSQVVALISLPQPHRWLFAGVYDTKGREQIQKSLYRYTLHERLLTSELKGRLVVSFARSGRASYLDAEKWADRLHVIELLPQPLSIGEFPGYVQLHLSKADLDLIVAHQLPSWKSALSSVGGVYVISDAATGKMYVGSATGEGGIWSRWSAYSASGHGGNRELRLLLQEKGAEYAGHFSYAILETADTKTSDEEILQRESHWKRVLLTREYGYNAN